MSNHLVDTLETSQLCCRLSGRQIRKVAESARLVHYSSGDVVFRQDDPGDSMFVVIKGRVKIEVSPTSGSVRFVDYLHVGEHFGELALLTGGLRTVTMTAVMDCELLELKQDAFQRLLMTVPGLAANVCRTLGFRLRRETTGRQPRSKPRVIGLVNNSTSTQRLWPRLAAALTAEGDAVRVLTEDVQRAAVHDLSCFVDEIPGDLGPMKKTAWIHEGLSRQSQHDGHTLVNLKAPTSTADLQGILLQCEQVWWLAEPGGAATASSRLRSLLVHQPQMPSRIHWVWILDERDGPAKIPSFAADVELAQPEFKVTLSRSPQGPTRHQRKSISRLVRHIHGTRIGLALGGGAARGLAHLGVLRALEREGFYFDLISGTSAGALTALPYAYGWDLDDAIDVFKQDLTPGWFFRRMPRGNQWFMMFKFRTRGWEPMLRRHFGDVRLEQLYVPLSTVAVDLVSGQQIVRDQGDAVNAVLESINLPSISPPILRDSMALVDGGIFNNVPADLLPERGADLVVGIDIAAKLSQRFAGNTPETPTHKMRAPGQLETIMRANEVQDHEITALRTKAVDLMISVDTSAFDFADFTKARELAEAGEQAAEQVLPQLKQLLVEQKESESVNASRFVCPVTV